VLLVLLSLRLPSAGTNTPRGAEEGRHGEAAVSKPADVSCCQKRQNQGRHDHWQRREKDGAHAKVRVA